jgi:cytidine deaminase
MPLVTEYAVYVEEYSSIAELPEQEQQLMRWAQKALENAYAPYSHYLVGCALLLSTGEVVLGSNQENAAYPSGMCAERVALFACGAQHPGAKIVALAVTAKKRDHSGFSQASSCGGCRQVMSEYEFKQDSPIRVLMQGPDDKILATNSTMELLPLNFSPDSLKS